MKGSQHLVLTRSEIERGWGVSKYLIRRAMDKGELQYRVTNEGLLLFSRASVKSTFGVQLKSINTGESE